MEPRDEIHDEPNPDAIDPDLAENEARARQVDEPIEETPQSER